MKKSVLFAAAAMAATSAFAADGDYYIIGSNVNGKEWALGAEDAAFKDNGNGIYEWNGEVLGTGFKLNDGTWDNPDHNFGSDGASKVEEGVPFTLFAAGNSGNIELFGVTEVKNPKVVFDANASTITVTGEFGGEIKWFLTGFNGVYNCEEGKDGAYLLKSDDGIIFNTTVNITVEEGEFKVTSSGWGTQYGKFDENSFIDATQMICVLGPVGSADACPYVLTPGNYDVEFNMDELTVSFKVAGDDSGVDGIEVENAAPVYYNLQGVRVANPENGVFVKVAGSKAVKVAL